MPDILFLILLILIVVDVPLFMATPSEYRMAGGRWWRMLPGGGIVVWIMWKWSKR